LLDCLLDGSAGSFRSGIGFEAFKWQTYEKH